MFSPEGRFLKTITPRPKKQDYDGLSFIEVDKLGNLYVMAVKFYWKTYKDFFLGEMKREILKLSPDGVLLKVIYSIKSPFSCEKGGKGNITIPFHNPLYFDVCEGCIVIKEASREYISVYNLEGKKIKNLRVPFEKKKVTGDDVDKWIIWIKKVARGLIERGDFRYKVLGEEYSFSEI